MLSDLEEYSSAELIEELKDRGYVDFGQFRMYLEELGDFLKAGNMDHATKSFRNFLYSMTGFFPAIEIIKKTP